MNPIRIDTKRLVQQDSGKEYSTIGGKDATQPVIDTNEQHYSQAPFTSVNTELDGTKNGSKQEVSDTSMGLKVDQPRNETEERRRNPFANGEKVTSISSSPEPARVDLGQVALRFRVEKYNALGLLMPQSQKFLISSVDTQTGANLGPAFSTSKMSWIDVLSALPPPYEIYTASPNTTPQLVSRALPRGWQGLVNCRVELECWAPCPSGPNAGIMQRGKWLIDRTLRTYKCTLTDGQGLKEFSWKGATSAVKDLRKQAKAEGKKVNRLHKGNFKCVTPSGELLALWVQARSMDDLGDLYIFESAKDKLAAQVILSSILVPVVGERVSGMNWVGGFGRSL